MTRIKNKIKEILKIIKKNQTKLIVGIFELMVTILIVLESGFLFFKFGASSRIRIIVLAALFLVTTILYLATIKKDFFKTILKEKIIPKPSFAFVFLIFYSLIILISFLLNKQKNLNLYSYLDLLILGWIVVLFIKSISFQRFCHIYSKTIGIICFIALVFYVVVHVVNIPFSSSIYFHDGYLIENYNFLYFDYSTNLEIFAPNSSDRIMGIFWEPGVFASHILIAFIIDFVINKKHNIFISAIELICLIFTFSTAGWILLPIVVVAFISEKFKNHKKHKIINAVVSAFGIALTLIVIFLFQDKILSSNSSLMTRVLSPYYSLQAFVKKPFFGFGPVSANEYYYSIVPSSVTAITSTFGYFMMSIGFFGIFTLIFPIIGIAAEKKLSVFTRVVLCIFVVLAMSKENQSSIYSIFIFYFYFAFRNIRFKYETDTKVIVSESFLGSLVFKDNSSVTSNVFWAFLVKVGTFVVGLVTVPVFNTYFGNDTSYGVWLTIISVLSWILMFDFGFSNGLRSKLSASLQAKDDDVSKKYVTSTYKVSLILGILIMALGIVLGITLNWNRIYNIDSSQISSSQLKTCMIIVLCSVGLQFALRPILSILEAMKKSAVANSLALISNVLLIVFAIMSSSISLGGNYIALAVAYLFFINSPLIIASFFVFRKHRNLLPSFKTRGDKGIVNGLVKLNIVFFVIQISQLLLYAVNDVLISNLFNPGAVSEYTKYYKLFATIISTFTGVFQAPLWVSIARAKENNNISLIKKIFKATIGIGVGFLTLALVVCLCLPFIFDIWLGENAPTFIWFIAFVFFADAGIRIMCCSLTIVGNGLEAVKSQAIIFFVAALVKIPLSILLKNVFPSLSFAVVILAGDLVIWTALIALPIEINKKIKKIQLEGKKSNEKEC